MVPERYWTMTSASVSRRVEVRREFGLKLRQQGNADCEAEESDYTFSFFFLRMGSCLRELRHGLYAPPWPIDYPA